MRLRLGSFSFRNGFPCALLGVCFVVRDSGFWELRLCRFPTSLELSDPSILLVSRAWAVVRLLGVLGLSLISIWYGFALSHRTCSLAVSSSDGTMEFAWWKREIFSVQHERKSSYVSIMSLWYMICCRKKGYSEACILIFHEQPCKKKFDYCPRLS